MRVYLKAGSKLFGISVLASMLGLSCSTERAEVASTYQMPSEVLVDLIDAPTTPDVSVGPNRKWLLLLERPSLPSIEVLAQRELRLAGLRINPRTSAPSRRRPVTGLKLLNIADRSERQISGLPKEPSLGNVRWAPDGSAIAFTHTRPDGVELWVADVSTGKARRLSKSLLNLSANEPPQWLPDSQGLICTFLPERRGAEPEIDSIPIGPIIQENMGKVAPARTYQDLLHNSYDEALFDYYLTAQLATISLRGKITNLGEAGIIWNVDPSPDGKYLLVELIHRPYSYLVPVYRFPKRVEVWDMKGRLVHQVADLPLHDEVPIAFDSVPTGPRSVGWRSDVAATLVWTEALDGGNGAARVQDRDQIYMLAAPFEAQPVPLITLAMRYRGVTWGTGDLALVNERWRKSRQVRTWIVKPDSPQAPQVVLIERSYEDRYGDPGSPVTIRNSMGRRVLLTAQNGQALFFIGEGASPEGNRPFIDRLDLLTNETERLFRSEAPYYERPVLPVDDSGNLLLTRREAVDEPPNYFLRDLGAETMQQVTSFTHPWPQLAGIQKELIRYRRADGVQLSGTLILPAGYQPAEGPLPMIMWAYPREFKSAAAASQVTSSPYRFNRLSYRSPLVWITKGYAVLDGPTMPIIGEGDARPNDTYIEQLVQSASAAVDEVVRRGVADRDRIAIGGHSYGAFMAANLLAHSDLFAAGIARSGAYNRTLTPFGFQAEERTVWEAPEVYFRMSPFLHAEDVNEPILLIHGEADNNSGTFPVQSKRFYHALKGLGATTRLVLLPHESHGYQARESILHMLFETERWLDTYVMRAGLD